MTVVKNFFKCIYLIFLISVFPLLNLFPQQPKITFEHFGIEQGALPIINSVFQDRIGFLWFGTLHGVLRYDGYLFKPYTTVAEYSSNVTNAEVKAICDDNEGNIWIGHIQGLDKLNPATQEVIHYILNPSLPATDWSNHVLSLLLDRNDNLWVGTGNGLYLRKKNQIKFKRITHDSTDSGSLNHNTINAICESRDGEVWFGTGNGLDKFDKRTNKFIHYWNDTINKPNWNSGSSHWIISIFEDREGTLWLGTSGGLVKFDRKFDSFTLYKNNPKDPASLSNNVVPSICEDLNGNLWLSSEGLDIFNKKTKKIIHYGYDKLDPKNLNSYSVTDILYDKSGTIWITTSGVGIIKCTPPNQFIKEYITADLGEITNTGWGNLVEDYNGKIWIGTDKGLLSFNAEKEIFKKEHLKGYIAGILLDKDGTLWINNSGTLYVKENDGDEIKKFIYQNGKELYESISSMCNASDGSIWIGTSDGKILKFDQHKKTIELLTKYDNLINTLYEDKERLLWVGTYDAGVILYDPVKKAFTRFYSDPKDSLTLNSNSVYNFCEDGTGTLWIITGSAPNKYDKIKKKCIRWGGKEGFPRDGFSLIDDIHGNIWMSTINAVVKYNPFTKEVKTFEGIKVGWGYRVRNGELYFVSTTFFSYKQCIMRFNPDKIANNNFNPPITITTFKKFEKPLPFGKSIQLHYDENFISFEFAALSFIHPEKNQYAYKMEGVDKDWIHCGTRRYASYPNLGPGEYVFKVKGSNNDGVWNEEGTSLAIIISPPWWKTWWAYSVYTAIFIFALYGMRRYELNRAGLKNKIKMDEAVLKEREETDNMKARFFANISHEFRTPLTLILGPAEKIFSNESNDHTRDADIIRRNSRRLLQLINQLLDLSKLEAGKLKLEASNGNIVSFVKGTALSFESLAESKDITLKISAEKEFIELYFDKEKMIKILTNILSNAFKFTPEEGMITISIAERHPELVSGSLNNKDIPGKARNNYNRGSVEINIRDTGIGIAQEEIPKLFDRFYQVDSSHTREYEGTGIGLALTKELVELHHGRIKVESEKRFWTEFTLEFPLGRDHLKKEEIFEEKEEVISTLNKVGKNFNEEVVDQIHKENSSSQALQNDVEIYEEQTIILIVEDNYDMRQYIRESLRSNYLIEEAVNGEQGVRKAEKIIPDLIVSDMMMPKMDGNELVKNLKNNEKTSHIPIILLTAKAGQEHKLEGLETGADDYLTKPFDIKELQIRIKNLINIRKRLQEKFSNVKYMPKGNETRLSSIDEKFMKRVIEIIEKNLSEEGFSIEDLALEIGMSRSQVHRKIKALTGKSPSVYMRTLRLLRGKEMIEAKIGNISEIAYSVGFSSPAYFTRCFKEEFGYTPSNFNET